MKTVRLSMQLQSDITDAARKKFKNANPKKEYPDDGYSVCLLYTSPSPRD